MTARPERAQATLVAAAVAVILLVGATAMGVALADEALANADRQPLERRAARTLADRLLTADATTHRDGVLRADRVANLTVDDLERLSPPVAGRGVRVRIGNATPVDRTAAGTTVRRTARVGRAKTAERRLALADGRSLTVPAGVERVRIHVGTANNTTVRTVLADGRPVLHAGGGIEGSTVVRVARHDPTRFRFLGNGTVGRARVDYVRVTTRPVVVEVTVDG